MVPELPSLFKVFGRLEPMARRTDMISRSKPTASDKKSRFISIPSDPTGL